MAGFVSSKGGSERRAAVASAAFGLALCGMLAGCRQPAPAKQPEAVAVEQTKPGGLGMVIDPATLGAVSGTVKLVGKPPEPVRLDTSMDPGCVTPGHESYAEQVVAKGGRLANVYVYVKSGPAAAMARGMSPAGTVVMDQVGCVYVPHVVAVMAGGSVEFHNSDSMMHNIHTMPTVAGNAVVDTSQGSHGRPLVAQFRKAEAMIPVRCNIHPWMSAFVNVSATPWFAVTGADGRFELKGLPAGDYVLGFVHETLGEQDVPVTVKAQSVAAAEASFAVK